MKALLLDLRNTYGVEKARIASDVLHIAEAKISRQNLFGWKTFIDDVIATVVSYMIETDFALSGGIYVNCAMQSAIDHCRYCNAQKRRHDYDHLNLDDFYNISDTRVGIDYSSIELYESISQEFGEDVAKALKPYIFDNETKIEKDLLKKVKTQEFLEFLKGNR